MTFIRIIFGNLSTKSIKRNPWLVNMSCFVARKSINLNHNNNDINVTIKANHKVISDPLICNFSTSCHLSLLIAFGNTIPFIVHFLSPR